MFKKLNSKKGFTLIELLIVIAVMAILATVVFVALNPLARFQDSRNSRRWTDVNAYLSAIKLYQVDHGGLYFDELDALTEGLYYQIGVGDECADTCSDTSITLQVDCVDLETLVDSGYIPEIMADPNAEGADTDETRYYLSISSTGAITVGSCGVELGSASAIQDIHVKR